MTRFRLETKSAILIFVFVLTSISVSSLWPTRPVSAHGTNITYHVTTAVEIDAAFDSGEPMANAQIAIYAPSDPATPWKTGMADENGHFVFTPDPTQPGTWDISIRTAGHGEMVHIPLEENTIAISGGSGGLSAAQIVLISAAMIWGFVGTALYFSRKATPSA